MTITKTSPLCIVKSLLREVHTSLPLFLLWPEKFAFSLQLGKLTKIQFCPDQRHTLLRYFFGRNCISSLDKIVCRGKGEWTNLQQPPLGWNDPFPDEYSWDDVKQISYRSCWFVTCICGAKTYSQKLNLFVTTGLNVNEQSDLDKIVTVYLRAQTSCRLLVICNCSTWF